MKLADESVGDSWGFDDSWNDIPPQPTKVPGKKDELLKRQLQRKQKQQAAREKRSAGISLKPSSLGAVKKE